MTKNEMKLEEKWKQFKAQPSGVNKKKWMAVGIIVVVVIVIILAGGMFV